MRQADGLPDRGHNSGCGNFFFRSAGRVGEVEVAECLKDLGGSLST